MTLDSIIGDELGPRYIIKVYNPKFKVWGYLVIDNTKLGPGKGGIRMTPTVNEIEVARLARAMTEKNALARLSFGGAKAGLAFDPLIADRRTKKEIIEWFARELKPLMPRYYIAGPDINMGAEEMAWFVKAAGNRRVATGKPKALGGLPHELGSTGYGVALAAELALQFKKIPIKGATVAIEGFGNVGTFAARFLTERGAIIIAVSDSRGVAYSPGGLDYQKLISVKKKTGSVSNYPGTKRLPHPALFALAVDLLIPAALPDVINDENVAEVKAKIIVEGANIPMRIKHEQALHQRGILVIPDIVANSGGVISSFAEHKGYSEKRAFALIQTKISQSVKTVLGILKHSPNLTPRAAAQGLINKLLRASED